MAAAIYEIRLLLAEYLGSHSEADTAVRLAAHLAYALHNEALHILEGDKDFNLDDTLANIKTAEKIVGSKYADPFSALRINEDFSSSH